MTCENYSDVDELLDAIVDVDPSDVEALDKIDLMVQEYLTVPKAKYTRSRDALKKIRPKEVGLCIYTKDDGLNSCSWNIYNGEKYLYHRGAEKMATEELAELYTIIEINGWLKKQGQ